MIPILEFLLIFGLRTLSWMMSITTGITVGITAPINKQVGLTEVEPSILFFALRLVLWNNAWLCDWQVCYVCQEGVIWNVWYRLDGVK